MSDIYGAASALAEIESETGNVMTYGGAVYPCVGGDNTARRALEIGGFSVDFDLQIAVRLASFTDAHQAAPQAQETVNFNGRRYRIESIVSSPCNSVLTLFCSDDSKGV